jgi:hypothetical protein
MPTNEPLYTSCYGCVHYCPYEGQFRLYFGEIQCALETEMLRQFDRKIARLAAGIERSQTSSPAVSIWLCPPGMDGQAFRFYPDEVLYLADLLAGSLTLIELNEFLAYNGFTQSI